MKKLERFESRMLTLYVAGHHARRCVGAPHKIDSVDFEHYVTPWIVCPDRNLLG